MKQLCIQAMISGRVQGVFFRQSTKSRALELGLTGHAINLADGRVEVVACGEKNNINELVKWLHTGPDMAQVSSVEHLEINIPAPTSFTTR